MSADFMSSYAASKLLASLGKVFSRRFTTSLGDTIRDSPVRLIPRAVTLERNSASCDTSHSLALLRSIATSTITA